MASACEGGAAEAPGETAGPTATARHTPASPTPSPTADPLGPPPRDAGSAAAALERYLAAHPGAACADPALLLRWDTICLATDLDGDSQPDAVYLVPFAPATAQTPGAGVVLVRRDASAGFEAFPPGGSADVTGAGRGAFGIADRNGDVRPEVTLLARACSASACAGRVFVETWDGTAWRDIGPGDDLDGLDRLAIEGTGAKTKIVMHGGTVDAAGAGPQRPVTVTYSFDGVRYGAKAVVPDPAVYLFHAVEDADDLFGRAKFDEAIAAYRAAIQSKDLRDWRLENGDGDGRTSLAAYALFRIAVAAAARGDDPNGDVDAVIRESREQMFISAAEAFRKGFQEGGGVTAGCREATRYLGQPPIPETVRQLFDYGFANFPVKTYRDICPL